MEVILAAPVLDKLLKAGLQHPHCRLSAEWMSSMGFSKGYYIPNSQRSTPCLGAGPVQYL